MTHSRLLPSEHRLIELAGLINFPTDSSRIMRVAASRGYSPTVVDFLKLFDGEDRFENGVDFINQCEELKLCVHEMRASMRELAYSPGC